MLMQLLEFFCKPNNDNSMFKNELTIQIIWIKTTNYEAVKSQQKAYFFYWRHHVTFVWSLIFTLIFHQLQMLNNITYDIFSVDTNTWYIYMKSQV